MKKANATRKYAKDVETLHQRDVWMAYNSPCINVNIQIIMEGK